MNYEVKTLSGDVYLGITNLIYYLDDCICISSIIENSYVEVLIIKKFDVDFFKVY